jgi:hypothetical protein
MRARAGSDRRVRRVAALGLAVATAVAGLTPAAAPGAGGNPRVSATPSSVRFGHVQTVSGHQWPVIEFCRRTVRLTLRSAQNAVDLGTARVRDNGTFTRRWTPRRSQVGAGAWKVVVRLRCESGKDGSTRFVRRSVPVTIRS